MSGMHPATGTATSAAASAGGTVPLSGQLASRLMAESIVASRSAPASTAASRPEPPSTVASKTLVPPSSPAAASAGMDASSPGVAPSSGGTVPAGVPFEFELPKQATTADEQVRTTANRESVRIKTILQPK